MMRVVQKSWLDNVSMMSVQVYNMRAFTVANKSMFFFKVRRSLHREFVIIQRCPPPSHQWYDKTSQPAAFITFLYLLPKLFESKQRLPLNCLRDCIPDFDSTKGSEARLSCYSPIAGVGNWIPAIPKNINGKKPPHLKLEFNQLVQFSIPIDALSIRT